MRQHILLFIVLFALCHQTPAQAQEMPDTKTESIPLVKLQQQRIAVHEKLFLAAQQAFRMGYLNQAGLDSKEIELIQVKLGYETQGQKRTELLTRIIKLEKAKLGYVERDYALGQANHEDKLQQESRVLNAEIELLTQQK